MSAIIYRCEWCYSDSVMFAYTERHGSGIYLCSRHYRELQRDIRADSLSRLSGVALEIVRDAHTRERVAVSA